MFFLKEKRDDKENTTLMNAYSSEFKTNEKERKIRCSRSEMRMV